MASRTSWKSASIKLQCGCTFSIPVVSYFDYEIGEDVECSTHGSTPILRVSRLGTS